MDQGIETSRITHVLRLALLALGVVLGLLVLSAVLGTSSASAATSDDEPAPSLGTAVGGLVQDVVEPVAAPVAPVTAPLAPVTKPAADAVQTLAAAAPAAGVTTPVAEVTDDTLVTVATKTLEPEFTGDVLGSAPVGSLLAPVAAAVDDTLAGTVAPIVGAAASALKLATPSPDAVAALTAPVATAATLIAGTASGALPSGVLGGDDDMATLAVSGGGAVVPAAVLGAGVLLLLAAQRRGLLSRAMPGSPVYATDSSPD